MLVYDIPARRDVHDGSQAALLRHPAHARPPGHRLAALLVVSMMLVVVYC